MKKAKLYQDRVKKLAKFLRELPPERKGRFDMDHYIDVQEMDGVSLECALDAIKLAQKSGVIHSPVEMCNTSACALGWATAIPEFAKAGLALRVNEMGSGFPTYKGEVDYGEKFFGMTDEESDFCFGNLDYNVLLDRNEALTPKAVAKRLLDVSSGKFAKAVEKYPEWKYSRTQYVDD